MYQSQRHRKRCGKRLPKNVHGQTWFYTAYNCVHFINIRMYMPVYTYSFNYVHLLVNIYDIYKYRLFVNYNPFERDSFFLYFHFILQTFSLSLSFFLSIYNIQYIYIYIYIYRPLIVRLGFVPGTNKQSHLKRSPRSTRYLPSFFHL